MSDCTTFGRFLPIQNLELSRFPRRAQSRHRGPNWPLCDNNTKACRRPQAGATFNRTVMASSAASSLRNLVRPSIPIAPRIHPVIPSRVAFFSATSFRAAAPPPTIKSRRDLPKKAKRTFKKKTNVVAVKKPSPGERKAFRKRIQLSNNSALPVQNIDELTSGAMVNSESKGKMFALPDKVVDQLRALEAFKATQTWNLFRRPHFLVRDETVELVRKLEESLETKEALRCVLTGSKLSGKSLALLQSMSYALMNDWVVVHIPEGTASILASLTFLAC